MPGTREHELWVVYTRGPLEKMPGVHAVCEQAEWDAMGTDEQGLHTLVREGIGSEGEAERLARGTSGDRTHRLPRRQ